MNEQKERADFEAWAATYSTLSLEHDAQGNYVSMEQELLWHGFQAGKAKAPEGAFVGGGLDADARLGLAGADSACAHEFALAPTSSIQLCVKCGIGETAANKQARAALSAQGVPAGDGDFATVALKEAHDLLDAPPAPAQAPQAEKTVRQLRATRDHYLFSGIDWLAFRDLLSAAALLIDGRATTLSPGRYVNALDFGVDPTGQRDSSDALRAAIAAAGSGGTVYLPKGTYRV